MTICWADSEKPTADQCLGDTLSFRIEIPAGTKQKLEFNDETGEMEKDYKDEKLLGYPSALVKLVAQSVI
jgi:hypothetical protein